MIKNLFLYKPFKKLTKKQLTKLHKQRNQTMKIMQKGLKPYTNGQPSPFLIKKEPNWIRVHGGPATQANKFMRINRLRSSKSRKFRASLQLSLVNGFKRWFKLTKLVHFKQVAQSSVVNATKTSDEGTGYTGYSLFQTSWTLLTALENAPASILVKMGFSKSFHEIRIGAGASAHLSKHTILVKARAPSPFTSMCPKESAHILNHNSKPSSCSWDLECLLKQSIPIKRIPIP